MGRRLVAIHHVTNVIPHFALPFRINGAGAPVVNDQDSQADIHDCVAAVVRTPVGTRIELPDFGRPDQTFTQGEIETAELVAAVEQWEPRALAAAAAAHITVADYVSTITLEIEGGAA